MVSSIRSFFSSSANSFFFKEQDSSVDELFGLIGKIRHEGINDKNLSSVLTKKEVCIRNARGNCFSRFILKKFFSAKIKLRNAKIAVAKNEIKELTKFHSIGLKNTSLSGKKFLKDLLIENHLFERMHKFGHKFQFSHDGTPVFQFQRMDSLRYGYRYIRTARHARCFRRRTFDPLSGNRSGKHERFFFCSEKSDETHFDFRKKVQVGWRETEGRYQSNHIGRSSQRHFQIDLPTKENRQEGQFHCFNPC